MAKAPELESLGSLITIKGTDQCLGALMNFTGHGVYDPTYGRVEVTPEQAEIHNRLLDEAMLKGLDENCEIGQWGTFYFTKVPGTICGMPCKKYQVTTFAGTVVSEQIRTSGNVRKTIWFQRNGKQYKGILRKDADCFNFKRIA